MKRRELQIPDDLNGTAVHALIAIEENTQKLRTRSGEQRFQCDPPQLTEVLTFIHDDRIEAPHIGRIRDAHHRVRQCDLEKLFPARIGLLK